MAEVKGVAPKSLEKKQASPTTMEIAMATAEANEKGTEVCQQYMSAFPKTCRFGDKCKFLHWMPKSRHAAPYVRARARSIHV